MDYDQIRQLHGQRHDRSRPLAYMRGRTLNDAVIILDEGQNATPTDEDVPDADGADRIVVTGDITQVDLPGGTPLRPQGRRGHPHRRRGRRLQPAHQSRRRTPQAGRPDRRRLRGVRRARPGRIGAGGPAPTMSIEILNESGHDLDVSRLAGLSRFVMDRMRVDPQAEPRLKAVDEATIAELNQQWMEKDGPTDVLAFPMDELRPGLLDEEPVDGVLGDLVLCPAVAERQGATAGHGTLAEGRAADRPRHPPPAGLLRRRRA